jgi:hypothetical protein
MMWVPIRDRQKEPTATETENRQIALQSLRKAIGKAQRDWDEVYTINTMSSTPLSIDPTILQEEHKLKLSERGGLQVNILVEDSEEGGDNGASECENGYQRSVASLDSIAQNADFESLGLYKSKSLHPHSAPPPFGAPKISENLDRHSNKIIYS